MLPITRKISSYNHSAGNTKEYLVIHDTGNYIDDDEGNAHYFNEGDRQASAHYFVDEDSITQVVEDGNASWHCGDGGGKYGIGNHNSIGIEMCNDYGTILEKTIENTIDLVKYLMNKYNIPIDKVVRHYDASRKTCPHNMSANNWAKWYEFKNRLAKGIVPSVTNGWSNEFGVWYYYENKVRVINKWEQDSKKLWYFLGGDGAMVADRWIHSNDGKWYYLGNDGAMLTNTKTPDGYIVDNNGVWDGKTK